MDQLLHTDPVVLGGSNRPLLFLPAFPYQTICLKRVFKTTKKEIEGPQSIQKLPPKQCQTSLHWFLAGEPCNTQWNTGKKGRVAPQTIKKTRRPRNRLIVEELPAIARLVLAPSLAALPESLRRGVYVSGVPLALELA